MLISDISCRTLIYKDMNSAQRTIEIAKKAGHIVRIELVKVESLDLECVKVKIIYRVGDYYKADNYAKKDKGEYDLECL